MKLRHIVPSLERQHGGPSVSVRALCGALATAGHTVELLSTEAGLAKPREEAPQPGLTLRTFRRGWPQRICPSAGMRAAAGRGAAEVIHHHGLWLRTLHYAVQAKRSTGAKLVVSPRGMMEPWAWQHHRLRKAIAQYLVHPGALAEVDGWHATSTEEAEGIRALGFRQPIGISPNGVAVPTEAAQRTAEAYWRAEIASLKGGRVALFYSRFHPKKRVRELIELWAQRPADDWRLLVVGIPDSITVAELTELARTRGVADRVLVRDGTAAPAPYAVAQLFLLPTHSENFGLVVAESMAAGVPVVVTDTTPWRQLNAAQLGWCVSWADFERAVATATALQPEVLAARGAAARAWIDSTYSWQAAAARLTAFYRELVNCTPS